MSVFDNIFDAIDGKKITVSIGIADVSDSAISAPDKLIQATDTDMALYEATKERQNRIEIHKEFCNGLNFYQ
jgi:PleD family two-component response regulator